MQLLRVRSPIVVLTLLALVLSMGACVKHINLTPSQQAEYTLNQTIAVISSSNKAMAKIVIEANRTMIPCPEDKLKVCPLLSDALTNEILNYNRDVAVAVEGTVQILKTGKTWPERSMAALALLQQLKLPSNVAAFIKSPQVSAAVVVVVQTIVTVQQLVVQLQQGVGG